MSKRERTPSFDEEYDNKSLRTRRYTIGEKRKTYDDEDLNDVFNEMSIEQTNKRTLKDITQPNLSQLREKRLQYYDTKLNEKGGKKRRKTRRNKSKRNKSRRNKRR